MNNPTLLESAQCSFALGALLAFAGFVGCAAAPAAEPQAAAPAKDGAAQYQYPQPTPGTHANEAAPFPGVSSGQQTLQSEEASFEQADKQLGLALLGKSFDGQPLSADDRCVVVCKALGSMRSSAQHICSLQADRCASVQERVKGAEERAKSACPACAAPT